MSSRTAGHRYTQHLALPIEALPATSALPDKIALLFPLHTFNSIGPGWGFGPTQELVTRYPVELMISIDGSYGEGGGQIIRSAVSLAAITGRAVEVYNVRAKRTKPGLQPQHLAAVKAGAQLCAANLTGAAVGSTVFTFEPTKPVQAGSYRFEIGTAGSAPLVAQTVIVPLALVGFPSSINVTGGTHNPMAPSSDYLEHVYAPALREMGASISIHSNRAGYYPAGGGELQIELTGASPLYPIDRIQRGPARAIRAIVTTSELSETVFYRAKGVLEGGLEGAAVLHNDKESNGPGAAIVIVVEHGKGQVAFTGLGAKGKPIEKVAEEAIQQYRVWQETTAATDEHLADQLVLPAAFASGESVWTTPEVTDHLRSVLWLVEQFVPIKYEIGPTVKIQA